MISIVDPFFVFTYHNEIKGSHSIEVIYFARFLSPLDEIKIHPEDHYEYKWFKEEEINNGINDYKKEDDLELEAIIKGFNLLKESKLNFG